jgi:twinkle protein
MEEMSSLVTRLDITIFYVSHLATPEGKPHEEGGRVMLRHFRGSRAIVFWSHFVIGLERNQQADDPIERTITTMRMLKDRLTGRATGETLQLQYDRESGMLQEQGATAASFGLNNETPQAGGEDF